MLLIVSKVMRLYLCIAQVDLERNCRFGSLCTYDMNDVGFIWYAWYLSKLLSVILTTICYNDVWDKRPCLGYLS